MVIERMEGLLGLLAHDTRYRGMDCGRGRHLSAVCQEAKAARFTSHLEGEQLTVDPSAWPRSSCIV